ncbi:hypothetical protein V6Z11_A11G369200 [Gossypium hirsutum]|uniref:Disease resistance RPP13-like protein 1 isoform X3 n=1 Tax=Gossypium hirsutum TaxID=3635 RepID=A0ABM2Z3E2_GOSHI|nr:putative disease resistance RPP13-like protein 1 isoform X3 [Gossypium hirsutum]
MSVIGEAALSVFLELLGGKLLDSALNFVADHKQLHPQLKQWQSMLPDIQAVLDNAEEKQIKNEGVKKWLEDLQDLAYDVDDILDEFAYEELRLQLQKTQAQASTSKALKAKLAKNIGEIQLICFSLFDLVKRTINQWFLRRTSLLRDSLILPGLMEGYSTRCNMALESSI